MAKTILVADDEACVLAISKRYIEKAGYKVVTAESGQKALDYLDKNTIDLLVTDCDMPGLKGPDLIKILREKSANFPIVIVTTHSEKELAKEYGEKLYDYHIPKPIDFPSYMRTIQDILKE